MKTYCKLLVALSALTISGGALAQGWSQVQLRHVYYSDTTRTEVVGYLVIYCDGTVQGNGYPTPHYDEENYDCP